jgi:hypothetical protein
VLRPRGCESRDGRQQDEQQGLQQKQCTGRGQQGRAPEHAQGIGRQLGLALQQPPVRPLLDHLAQSLGRQQA